MEIIVHQEKLHLKRDGAFALPDFHIQFYHAAKVGFDNRFEKVKEGQNRIYVRFFIDPIGSASVYAHKRKVFHGFLDGKKHFTRRKGGAFI